jgi:hypothetical protein
VDLTDAQRIAQLEAENAAPARLKRSMTLAKSRSERDRRSTL